MTNLPIFEIDVIKIFTSNGLKEMGAIYMNPNTLVNMEG